MFFHLPWNLLSREGGMMIFVNYSCDNIIYPFLIIHVSTATFRTIIVTAGKININRGSNNCNSEKSNSNSNNNSNSGNNDNDIGKVTTIMMMNRITLTRNLRAMGLSIRVEWKYPGCSFSGNVIIDHGDICPFGGSGVLWIDWFGINSGYHNHAKLTTEKCTPNYNQLNQLDELDQLD